MSAMSWHRWTSVGFKPKIVACQPTSGLRWMVAGTDPLLYDFFQLGRRLFLLIHSKTCERVRCHRSFDWHNYCVGQGGAIELSFHAPTRSSVATAATLLAVII